MIAATVYCHFNRWPCLIETLTSTYYVAFLVLQVTIVQAMTDSSAESKDLCLRIFVNISFVNYMSLSNYCDSDYLSCVIPRVLGLLVSQGHIVWMSSSYDVQQLIMLFSVGLIVELPTLYNYKSQKELFLLKHSTFHQKEQLQEIFNVLPDAIFVFGNDTKSGQKFQNSSADQLFGIQRSPEVPKGQQP